MIPRLLSEWLRILPCLALILGRGLSGNQAMAEGDGEWLLHILLAVSSASEFNTMGVIPAVDLALEAVNNRSKLFKLSYNRTVLDLQVSIQYNTDAYV